MSFLTQTFCEKWAQVLAHTCAYAHTQTSCMARVRSAQQVRRGVAVSLAFLEQFDYFDGVNSVLAGDAATGELYYARKNKGVIMQSGTLHLPEESRQIENRLEETQKGNRHEE